jgi:guanylate kinase
MQRPRGTLFVVSAPSGAGKTSLVRALIEADSALGLSVSHTTRPKRDAETDGDHYYFVTPQQFQDLVDADGFLEHATVFGNRYGTSRAEVERLLEGGRDVVLEIDWQGARQVRERAAGCVGIFVLPPSLDQLRARLEARGQDDAAVISQRMQAAVDEMSHYEEFDYLVVNDDFAAALAQMQAVVLARRLRRAHQRVRHAELLAALLAPWSA